MGKISAVYLVEQVQERRDAIARALNDAGHFVVSFDCLEHFSPQQVEQPGCMLLDVDVLRDRSLRSAAQWDALFSRRPVIFLDRSGDVELSVAAMKAGAIDVLTTPVVEARLFAAVDQAMSVDASRRREDSIRRMISERLEQLTPREREVMAHVAYGRLNKQIAATLGICEKTIKIHRARMLAKMRVRSVAELVQLGTRVGIALEPVLAPDRYALNWKQNYFSAPADRMAAM
jgi:FixJ family two-component response regulator